MTIELNKKVSQNFIVEDQHSAFNMGSGDLMVLSTPSLVAFMENVCKNYLNSVIASDLGSVGSNININHNAPTKIGQTVTVEAEVTDVIKEKIIKFSVVALCDSKIIATAEHTRVIINNEKFLEKLM